MARELVGMWSSGVSDEEVYTAVMSFIEAKDKSGETAISKDGIGVHRAGAEQYDLGDHSGDIIGVGE